MSGVVVMMLASSAHACEDWVAKVVAVEGQVQRQNGQQDWQAVQREQRICPGDSVKVGGNSRASLHLRNNTFTRLDADSILRFPAQNRERHFWIELQQGVAHFISRIVHQFEVSTPYVNAVVEGTEFVVTAREQGAVAVMEGKVTAYNEKSRTSLTAGEQVTSAGNQQDLTRFNVPANTLVEWAIYYPPVLSLADLPIQTEQEKSALNAAIDALKQNRIDQALAGLVSAPRTDAIQLAQATLLLQLGRMPEFNRTVDPLLQGSLSGQAHGLKAIAAVSRNEIESARTHADLSVQRAPDSSSSWLALSYVQQADLQLNAAQDSARKAMDVQPGSVLAYLRMSELYLAQGDVSAAQKALASVPADAAESAELEGSKGFVQLFRLKLDSARKHFERALAMDSNNPQYQLGLGLTLLRDGDLEEGRQHIEYAVNLDPLRSVLRSYLGRAYFEEKRDEVAVEQWELAKQFDPNDPTPYFYSGVQKLFANDPIGAVEDLETSRDLNDKRALYRSETLLQSDAASRSATLARAYDEVGYDQGVLLSGWDALRRDPTSSEGHRLMADFYAGDPRYETARVSELLQSQIWQPLSAYPLQPQLSEANLAVVAGAGPQRPGPNEYHSLFTQDGVYGMVNGYGGSDNTWGDDLVGSFLAGPLAVSLGQYHFESDGWRENADQEQDIYNGLVQWQVTPSTSLQYEHRDMRWDKGFLTPTVGFVESFLSSEETDRVVDRIGAVHRYSASGAVLLSIVKQNWQVGSNSIQDLGPVVFSEDSDSMSTELQWVANFNRHKFVAGASYIDLETADTFNQSISADLGGFIYEVVIDRAVEGSPKVVTGYLDYSYHSDKKIDIDAGLGFYDWHEDARVNEIQTEYFDGLDIGSTHNASNVSDEKTKWLPSFGVAYRPIQSLQLRAAAYYSVAKPLYANQSIEPTSLAGFNRLYNDIERIESKNYAFGVDGASPAFKYGALFVGRKLEVPEEGVFSETYSQFSERVAEIYTSVQSLDMISASLSVKWNQKEARDENALLFSSITNVTQYQVPIRLAWHGSNSISIFLEQSYYHQDVEVLGEIDGIRDDDWVTDLVFQYRLPRRLGLVNFGAKNIFDENSEHLSFSERELAFYPKRFLFAALNFNF